MDCGPDFRQQMLQNDITKVDAILMTHEHNDHMIGLDDVRPFNFMLKQDLPVYAVPRVQTQLKIRFDYIFQTINRYPGAPMIKLNTIDKAQAFEVFGIPIQAIEVMHGKLPVLGFRIGNFAYITDMKTIAEEEFAKLAGVEHLIINALHHHPHHAHMNLEEAIAFAQRAGAKATYLTHASHRMGLYADVQAELPEGIYLAWDGLQVSL
ncbi:MAG: MBL fold metallo-hydrolase [Saprospiraceae bacterium]